MIRLLVALVGTLFAFTAAAQAGPRVAIFPFELIDVSLEGQYVGKRADETRRLVLATEELRRLASRDAGYEVLDLGGLASEIEKSAPLYKCKGCEIDMARRIGAEVAIAGTVRKISNLILIFHIFVSDVGSGKLTKLHRVDVRGNTDETWLRAVRRLVAYHLAGR